MSVIRVVPLMSVILILIVTCNRFLVPIAIIYEYFEYFDFLYFFLYKFYNNGKLTSAFEMSLCRVTTISMI